MLGLCPSCGLAANRAGPVGLRNYWCVICGRPCAAVEDLTLLSTVVAPAFAAGELHLYPVSAGELPAVLAAVVSNRCGHPVTDGVLRTLCPSLPPPERGFWDGWTLGLAVRPRGGVRGTAATGDTTVGAADLEAVLVSWQQWMD